LADAALNGYNAKRSTARHNQQANFNQTDKRRNKKMARDKSGLDTDDDFTSGSKLPSPMGGGGMTNIGGGTSGAAMGGNADTGVNPSNPINDVINPSLEDETSIAGGITDDETKDI